LDVSLFRAVSSQTTTEDRRSLLAVQRATAGKYGEYTYLEIGSHLGGSIQPHLADPRCTIIYSIDSRPSEQPDDRSSGHIARYEGNTTERMLRLLRDTGLGDIARIQCFDTDASEIDPAQIGTRPDIALIDGEHTKAAVLSDFQFCERVLSSGGTILFHDFQILRPAILEICDGLRQERRPHLPLKLEGAVFAIFFDPDVVDRDPYLSAARENRRVFWLLFHARWWVAHQLPRTFFRLVR